jgi:hypothetical protein
MHRFRKSSVWTLPSRTIRVKLGGNATGDACRYVPASHARKQDVHIMVLVARTLMHIGSKYQTYTALACRPIILTH